MRQLELKRDAVKIFKSAIQVKIDIDNLQT